jgi:hypothetical protein
MKFSEDLGTRFVQITLLLHTRLKICAPLKFPPLPPMDWKCFSIVTVRVFLETLLGFLRADP